MERVGVSRIDAVAIERALKLKLILYIASLGNEKKKEKMGGEAAREIYNNEKFTNLR